MKIRLLGGALRQGFAAAIAALFLGSAAAGDAHVGAIAIVDPYAAASLPGASVGAAYFSALDNRGAQADQLLKATTPVAAHVEMHTMAVDAKGVMRMREVDAIALAAKASVKMRPGMGYHLMLVGLKRPLKAGETFPMTLHFEHAGTVDVTVEVRAPGAPGAMSGMHKMN